MEEWKDIKDYEGDYQISNLGRVKSVKFRNEKILKLQINKNGYCRICLYKKENKKQKMLLIHRLLAQAFLGLDFDSDLVVNHKNHIRSDNNIDNLEIVNIRENASYKKRKPTSKYAGVGWHKNIKKWQVRIVINKELLHLGYFETEEQAHKVYLDALVKYDITNKYSEYEKTN